MPATASAKRAAGARHQRAGVGPREKVRKVDRMCLLKNLCPRLLVAGAVAALVIAASADAQAPRPNVLLVTIDTVRADHVGAYGYTKGATPTLDRLAREGVRFADATSQAPLTGPSHAAIL